jgi:hypothetical protein
MSNGIMDFRTPDIVPQPGGSDLLDIIGGAVASELLPEQVNPNLAFGLGRDVVEGEIPFGDALTDLTMATGSTMLDAGIMSPAVVAGQKILNRSLGGVNTAFNVLEDRFGINIPDSIRNNILFQLLGNVANFSPSRFLGTKMSGAGAMDNIPVGGINIPNVIQTGGADDETILTGGTVDPSDDIIVTNLAPIQPTGGGQDSSQPDFPTGGGTVVIGGQPGGQPSTSPVQEAERIRNVMEARKKGANIGFSAGGLASLPRYLKGR